MHPWTIRAADPADLPTIRVLHPVPSQHGKARDLIADCVANGSCWVVTQDEGVIAFGICDHTFYGHGMIWLIVVAENWRRRGIATELIQYFESICRSDRIFTSTNESNSRMQALLAKVGYERSGVIYNLDPNDPELVTASGCGTDATIYVQPCSSNRTSQPSFSYPVPRRFMRLRRFILRLLVLYAVLTVALAIGLGELPFHALRVTLDHTTPAQAMAARFGAPLQHVAITANDGVRLSAWFAHPANANGNAVILLHGVGDNREGMIGFAELFLSHGYSVLLPDSRAHGVSGGAFPTYGIKEADDVRRWYDWLDQRETPACVFGFGESMGAAIVLQSIRTTPFCAVVAESSFATFRQIAYIRVGQFFHTGPWLGRFVLRPAVELAFLYGRLTRGVWLPSASPESAVASSGVPILVIHGLADENIPPQQSVLIGAHDAGATLWLVPNAGHCGAVSVAQEEFNRRVLEWFAGHGAPKTVPVQCSSSG